eukprot:TRINITY_DN2381_c0_g7_i1.p1 TRINITY_DN2381_c0_g7~~TRINITY_DN2381_c0_g7_i1.p1  ORF type:complete len:490 (+),score=212.93 TRINITY_DN2381_c0_g7_i1:1039-2508(+)
MHIDSLKEQAAQLGITEVLEQNPGGDGMISRDTEESKRKGRKDAPRKRGAEGSKKGVATGEKLKMLKKNVKERKKMEKQLQQLNDERSKMMDEFTQKLIKKGKLKAPAKTFAEPITASSDASKAKDSKKPETDSQTGKPPKQKSSETVAEPVHRLNHSEFNKVFNRKLKNRNTSFDAKKKEGDAKAESSGREDSSEKHESIDQRQKILQEKEQRKLEERRRKENDLQQIRMENFVARQRAKEKKAQMLRPSSGMKMSFNIPLQGAAEEMKMLEEQKKEPKKIVEPYRLDEENDDESQDELEHIQEVINENDSDKDETEKDINMINTKTEKMKTLKKQLIEKTLHIEEQLSELMINPEEIAELDEIEEKVEETKNESAENPARQVEGLLHNLSSDGEEANSGDERLGEIASAESAETRKLNERIKLLRHRCEAGIGNILFEKAYNMIREERDEDPEVVRRALVKVMGEENIGFYAIIDQILYLETFCESQ